MKRNGRVLIFLCILLVVVGGGFAWLMGQEIPVERRTVIKPVDPQQFLTRDAPAAERKQP